MEYSLEHLIYAWVGYYIIKSLLKSKTGWELLYSSTDSFPIHLMFGVNLTDQKETF